MTCIMMFRQFSVHLDQERGQDANRLEQTTFVWWKPTHVKTKLNKLEFIGVGEHEGRKGK
jgi:hypothetical protein